LLLDRLRPCAPTLRLRTQAAISGLAAQSKRLCGATRVRLTGSGEHLTGAETAARIALHALQHQLVSELVDRNANLLGNGTLDGDVLRKLRECRNDLLQRNGRACLATQGKLLTQSKWELLAKGQLRPKGRLWVPKGGLRCESGLAGVMTELRSPVVRARLPEQARAHLRQPHRLQSGKLRQEALLGIL
jgi:hypothetical protein